MSQVYLDLTNKQTAAFFCKSIMLIFGYFHKSRLLYGLPAFIAQKSKIERIDNIMITSIKKLLKLTKKN